ncbi:MAG: DUF523 domain-containing protein [Candidatus Sedimenticola endophacoides]
MRRILISACLLGQPVRYDGTARPLRHPTLARWQAAGRLIALCPETAGGLPVPRPAAEIEGGDARAVLAGRARVLDRQGRDLTSAFLDGAHKALALCREWEITLAILSERSPSCGSDRTYDGTFSATLRAAPGVTTALLEHHGIRVFSQYRIEAAEAFDRSLHT